MDKIPGTSSQVSLISIDKEAANVEGSVHNTKGQTSALPSVGNKLNHGKKHWSNIGKRHRKVGVADVNNTSVAEAISKTCSDEEPKKEISFLPREVTCDQTDVSNKNIPLESAAHNSENGKYVAHNGSAKSSPKTTEHSPPSSKKQRLDFPLRTKTPFFKKKEPKETSKFKLTHQNSIQKFGHLSLLTPALVLEPTLHGKDVFTKKFTKSIDEDFLQLAASHIKDAINGYGKFGEARAIFKPKSVQRCFRITSSKFWAALLYLTIAVHSFIIFWEQPSQPVAIGQKWSSWTLHPVVLCINAVCLIIYISDLILHIVFLTFNNILHAKEKVWVRLEFVFTVFFVIDFIILVTEAVTKTRLLCPFRCFRASMLLCKSKNVAHIFNVLLSIISKLGKVLLIIAIFIITFASIGLHIFMNDYHNLPTTCCNDTASWNCTNIYSGAFDQVASAAMHMFVLMSTENYPEFIIPAFQKSWANFFYFGLYLYAGVFFLTAILLAIIVESYWDYSKRHVKQERRQQREELAKAWNLMDPLGNGQLSVDNHQLLKLFKILKPQNSDEENQELINYISMYGDGVIDSYDWTTKLIETLSYVFEEEPKQNAHDDSEKNYVICLSVQRWCKSIIHAKAASVVVLSLIFIHSILFCLTWYGIPDVVQLAIQSTKTAIVAVFVIEFMLRIIADGKNLVNVFDMLDMAMVILAASGSITWHVLFALQAKDNEVYLGACAVVSGLSILIRAVFNSQHARTAVAVLRNIYPVMFDLILLVITIIFFYAVLGLEIFQNFTLANSSSQGYEGSYVEYGCGVGFETFGCSLLIVFQIVTTNDWHEIMLGAILDAGWPSVFYFISCYLIVDMIVMNLFVAISIEAYKKLAIDSNSHGSINGLDNEQQDVGKTDNTSLKTTAKNTLKEIFASSRNPRLSVGSGTLTDFASSPYSVRRGTLGSLGARTPTPTPRLEQETIWGDEAGVSIHDKRLSPRRRPSIKVEEAKGINEDGGVNIPGLDKRQMALKQRQDKRRKERRKTKQEEKKLAEALKKEENKLQIDGVVRLKKAVQVIKAFHARNVQEMSIHEGDVVAVSEETQDMYRGPNGWFPSDHVVPVTSSNGLHDSSDAVTGSETEAQNHVKFNVPVTEVKKHPPSPHHRISQTRIKKRTDGGDWRRQILGDITIMNQDELNALSGKFKGGLGRRHTSHTRNSTYQLPQIISEELTEDEDEVQQTIPNLPRLTVSEVTEIECNQPDYSDTQTDTNTLTLPSTKKPMSAVGSRNKSVKGQNPPDWVENFANKNKIILDKDVKLSE